MNKFGIAKIKKDETKGWLNRLVQRRGLHKLIQDEMKKALEELGPVTKQDFQDMSTRNGALGVQEKA
jgi:hypothetical protein